MGKQAIVLLQIAYPALLRRQENALPRIVESLARYLYATAIGTHQPGNGLHGQCLARPGVSEQGDAVGRGVDPDIQIELSGTGKHAPLDIDMYHRKPDLRLIVRERSGASLPAAPNTAMQATHTRSEERRGGNEGVRTG